MIMATRAQGGSGMLGRQQLASMLGEVSRGDRAAFARLYEASSRKLYAIVLGIARRRELADDLLQEAYLRIWQDAAQFNPLRSSPMTWMATIARNCALDETRRAASRPTEDDSALLALPSDCTHSPPMRQQKTRQDCGPVLNAWARKGARSSCVRIASD